MGKFLGVKNILRQQQTKQNTLNGSEWKRVYAKMGFYEKSQMIISSSNWHWLDQCLAINAGPTFDPLSIISPVELLSDGTKGSNSAPIIWSTRSPAEKLVIEISCSARSRLTKRISWLYCENIQGKSVFMCGWATNKMWIEQVACIKSEQCWQRKAIQCMSSELTRRRFS